jgi:hypothetical protein
VKRLSALEHANMPSRPSEWNKQTAPYPSDDIEAKGDVPYPSQPPSPLDKRSSQYSTQALPLSSNHLASYSDDEQDGRSGERQPSEQMQERDEGYESESPRDLSPADASSTLSCSWFASIFSLKSFAVRSKGVDDPLGDAYSPQPPVIANRANFDDVSPFPSANRESDFSFHPPKQQVGGLNDYAEDASGRRLGTHLWRLIPLCSPLNELAQRIRNLLSQQQVYRET